MKKTLAWGCLLASFALPVVAQDEMAGEVAAEPAVAEEAPADAAAAEVPAADTPPADEVAAEPAVIDDGGAPAAEETASSEGSGDEGSGDEGASDEGSGEEGMGLNLYVGLEFDQTKVDVDDEATQASLGGNTRFDADFYKLRLGARLFDGVGVEFHAGFPASDSSADELEVKQFYGLYLVPTGVVMETVEVSVRLGYAFVELENDLGSEDRDGASFGLAAELPLRRFGESMPNLRFGVGATVYQEERSGRMYGFHGGIRYDFSL